MNIPSEWRDSFFFVTVSLFHGDLLEQRQTYWTKCLSYLENETLYNRYNSEPMQNFDLTDGPCLKEQVVSGEKSLLAARIVDWKRNERRILTRVCVKNESDVPAFPVCLRFNDLALRDRAEDNYFWLDAHESRDICVEACEYEHHADDVSLTIGAWNSNAIHLCPKVNSDY